MKYVKEIQEQGITAELIAQIIDDNKEDSERMLKLYQRYKACENAVPILERQAVTFDQFDTKSIKRLDDKVNNRLNNPFDVDIVDTKVGYMFGPPIVYDYDDQAQGSDKVKEQIDIFNLRNHVEDADAELGKMATICGKAARLAYIGPDGNERIKNIDPWQVIFIGDDIQEPVYSLRYYKDAQGALQVEFYDNENMALFTEDANGLKQVQETKHMFDFNPLYGVANNKEMLGDAERVQQLIDAYDRTLSDASNEIEQYRLAYLVLRGVGLDEETIAQLKKHGVWELFDKESDVSYLTKDINDSLIEHHLDRLERNIIKLAKSVDFSDETFGTSLSGVAMKFKLMALENKCIMMERKFTAMLRYQFKVIFSAWRKRKLVQVSKDDYLKVWFAFSRNLPVNLLEEANTQQALKGIVSEKTRLSLFSAIDDPDFEIEELSREQNEYMQAYGSVGEEGNGNTEGD
ncbi:phage portal protein [Shouchella clausii]|uniref:phage portal protein n=1 Tax=Shouchella clausii TaxID=79880 RepID=UPI000BA6515B|nr:phage portal protein [Shouchella clausii]PAD10185.1 phage portal protein [Shouchella clausii]PAE86167.1 phage portal protein [Shouchella clausii]PAF06849.1 phage portal protein [Shouchella clausii]